MIHFHIITLFPAPLRAYLDESIMKRARERKKISIHFYNPRDYAKGPHARVDERPFGGGPGMVMKAEPILKAVEAARGKKKNAKVILFTPRGKIFTNQRAQKMAENDKHLILIAGRYEGIDARICTILRPEEVSIGPYILTGGELPALVVIDSVTRHIPGVLGDALSLEESRGANGSAYTRPDVLVYRRKKYPVPRVLLSGNHHDIEEWKRRSTHPHSLS